MDVKEYNRLAWDAQVETGENEWTLAVDADTIRRARAGDFALLLTNNKFVPGDWFPSDLEDVDVLCLASGGGQQAPVLAAAGANVTSFDNSARQLEQDILVADREGLDIRTEQGDAADLSRFDDESFDLIFHPVSNCFMPDAEAVWNEAARVLRRGGVLLAGFHNGFMYVFDQIKSERDRVLEVRHRLPYSDIDDLTKEELDHFRNEGSPLEFGHTLDQQIGGQTRAGLAITGFYEDSFSDEATPLNKYCPIFAATKAVKL